MKKNNFSIPALIFVSLIMLNGCSNTRSVTSFEAMNTFMTIQSFGRHGEKANNEVKKQILNLEELISTTKTGSDIYAVNHKQNEFVTVSEQTKELVLFAEQMSEKTDGALNISLYPVIRAWGFTTGDYRIPDKLEINGLLEHTDYTKIKIVNDQISIDSQMMIDLGAVGKGYAGDLAIRTLKENGIKSALLDLGGNIQTLGTKQDGSEWTIGIKNPEGGNAVAGVKITNQAVITSGGYERYFTDENGKRYIHIFDGKTGCPVENDIQSITIICDSGVYGDALSTALFVMGIDSAVDFWKKNNDFQMIIISTDKDFLYSKGLYGKVTVLSDFNTIKIIE